MRLFTVGRYLLLACALGVLGLPSAMFAQHPAFLHALSDLRLARAYLAKQSPNQAVDNNCVQAIQQIDAAIAAIKKASFDDGKNLNDHPPIDARLERTGRLRKAKELLDKAHQDVSAPESDPAARALQGRINANIIAAGRFVDGAMAAAGH